MRPPIDGPITATMDPGQQRRPRPDDHVDRPVPSEQIGDQAARGQPRDRLGQEIGQKRQPLGETKLNRPVGERREEHGQSQKWYASRWQHGLRS